VTLDFFNDSQCALEKDADPNQVDYSQINHYDLQICSAPVEGMTISFQILEMTDQYTPEMISKVAKIISVNGDFIELDILYKSNGFDGWEPKLGRKGCDSKKFVVSDSDSEAIELNDDKSFTFVEFSSLTDPRIVN
jgi:hypothetical protein